MIQLALLWHMHQPYYEDLATGEHILPWVRLHAIKDYWGMAALLDEFPGVRVTFNLVPSLVVQLEAFAADRARDRHLEVGLAPPEELSQQDREFLVANGFHAHVPRMIAPYPRYAELLAMRRAHARFAAGDLRDLQVWQKLAWMDPDWLTRDPRLVGLVARDRGFTEADKRVLRDVELELLNAVIPAYRAGAARGQIELSASPFYHPILPLLCDTDLHLRAHPHATRPVHPFRHPEDARAQIERALAFHAERFGQRPAGMWPSEGSVSDEVVPLISEAGIEWMATDEDILARSLGRPLQPGDLHRPYELSSGRAPVRILFRDHALSDLIGFTYQSWRAEDAAADFLARVRDAGARHAAATGGETPTVAVILDGENAWEHYDGGGRPFLRALYGALARADDIQTVTMREAGAGAARPLGRLFPGSWINGDFYIWAGHRDDQAAWTQLADARTAYDEAGPDVPPADRARAFEELLIAEGSDWFWWYGDDHSSDHDREFDDLFRRHVRNVYRWLRLPVPPALFQSNISTGPVPAREVRLKGWLPECANGRGAGYPLWVGAEPLELAGPSGSMHQVSGGHVRDLRIGVTPTGIWVRAGGPGLGRLILAGDLTPELQLERPAEPAVTLTVSGTTTDVACLMAPLDRVASSHEGSFGLTLELRDRAGHLIERIPSDRAATVRLPPTARPNWLV